MSVVQRCPNCGTTQATSGDCQACHEAQVRYYCTNHEPGIWLAGPTCPQCDARSVPAPRPAPAATSLRSPRTPPPVADADAGPSRPPLWKKLLSAALAARAAMPATTSSERRGSPLLQPGGWVRRLAFRLLLIAMILVAVVVGGLYLVARSMR